MMKQHIRNTWGPDILPPTEVDAKRLADLMSDKKGGLRV